MPRTRTRIADQLLKTLEDIEQENLIVDSNFQQNFHNNTSNNNSYNEHNRSASRHPKIIHPEEEWPPLNSENITKDNKRCHRRPSPYSRPNKRKGTDVKSKRDVAPRHLNLSHYEETEDEDLGIVADQLKVIQESQDVLLADIRLEMEQLQLDNQCLRDENARLIAEKTHWESLYREMCENTKKMREHVNALKNPESNRDFPHEVKSDHHTHHHHRNQSQDRSGDRRNRRLEKRPSSVPRDNEDTPEEVATPPAMDWEKRPSTRSCSRKRSQQPRQNLADPPRQPPAPIYDDSVEQDRRSSCEETPDTGSVTSSQKQIISNRESSRSKDRKAQGGGCFGFLRKKNKKKKHKKHKLVEN